MSQHYGDVCTVWGWGNENSSDAARVIPKDENGSDGAENGLVSCGNHHRIFDADGFGVEPETAIFILKEGCLKETFDITKKTIAGTRGLPYIYRPLVALGPIPEQT